MDLTRVISFTSGKGGVGKTTTVVNLAIALANAGKSVLILDADLGLANVDIMLGIRPQHTISEVLKGKKTLEEVIVDGPNGVSIIPAGSGVSTVSELSMSDRVRLFQSIEDLAFSFDYLLIDTRAGIGTDVMYFNSASNEVVCVINDEPTSLTDAYALIKVLANEYDATNVSVLVNDVRDEVVAKKCFNKINATVERHLKTSLRYLGFIPTDPNVGQSIIEQRALLEIFPSSSAGLAFRTLAQRLHESWPTARVRGGMQFFFKQILELESYGG